MSEDNRSSRNVMNYFEYSPEDMKRDRSINWNERKTRDMVQAVANTINAELTLQKQIDNIAERYELPRDEVDEFLEKEYQDELSSEYLVDGAILTCTNSTKEEQCFEFAGDSFINRYFAKEDPSIDTSSIEGWDNDKVAGRLIVTENPTAEANNLKHATVVDSIGSDKNNFSGKYNIPCFGNCKRRPDSDLEMNIFHQIHKDENGLEKRKEGTCKYLMKLEKEWENYDLIRNYVSYGDDKQGDKPGITMTSILFCKHGGFIYPVTSGQSAEVMTLEKAIDKMTQYLRGEGITEASLNQTIDWVAENCGLTVNDMVKGQFSGDSNLGGSVEAHTRSQSFDNQIIAWTYYWNKKIENEFSIQFEIDPNIVKAIIAQESSFGNLIDSKAAKNPSRNVMQSLSTGNSTVWIASGIHPYDNMFHIGDTISYKMLDGVVGTDGDIEDERLPHFTKENFDEERKRCHFEDLDIIKNIFEIGNDGKYMVVFDKVTTNMSIATGVGILAHHIETKKNIYDGVIAYNSKVSYVGKINDHLSDMGCSPLVDKPLIDSL